ncbi:MAG: retropepsin-like aspartic protease [Caulobacteraceae bacterium]
MNRFASCTVLAVTLAVAAGQAARAECKLGLVATIPVTVVDNLPMVDATINGKPAHLRFSLGYQTMFWSNALKDYDLDKISNSADGMVWDLGGQITDVSFVHAREMDVGNIIQKNRIYYILYSIKREKEAGFYGNELFYGNNDIELDFPHGEVRVFKPNNCKDDDVLYWGGSYSVAEKDKSGYYDLKLDGKAVKAALGEGNEVTFVTPDGARQAGVDLQSAGSLPMGMVAGGMLKPIDASIAVFPELLLGDETIKNLPLAVADIFPDARTDKLPQVVLGADFFRSHRVYISREQKKMYFSYMGGVLFQDIYKRLGAEPPKPKPKQ